MTFLHSGRGIHHSLHVMDAFALRVRVYITSCLPFMKVSRQHDKQAPRTAGEACGEGTRGCCEEKDRGCATAAVSNCERQWRCRGGRFPKERVFLQPCNIASHDTCWTDCF